MTKMALAFCYKFLKMKKMKHGWSDTLFADYDSTFKLNAADGCFCQSDIFLKRYLCEVKLILVDLHFL